MIDPTIPADRMRLAKTMDYWHREMDIYREARRQTIFNFIGLQANGLVPGYANCQVRMGNLIQMVGRARQVVLASNDPRYLAVPNVPYAEHISVRIEEWLNRWSGLIGLGQIGREIALDSFCGWGITKTNVGLLPPGVRNLVKQTEGPMVYRISQDDFGFDGSAKTWQDITYQFDIQVVPLKDAQSYAPFLQYNPSLTAELSEWQDQNEYTDAQVNKETGGDRYACAMTRLVYVYLPHYGLEVVWPCNSLSFGDVANEPLLVRPWKGHHTGPYAIFQDLDIPDNLIPVAQVESVKKLDHVFNELLNMTTNQALSAKVIPTHAFGDQKDAERIRLAADRAITPLSKPGFLTNVEIPGPSQGQTQYMGAIQSMFKYFAGNVDDILGSGATAPTARQSELIREAVNANSAESRGKMDRLMEVTARKLAHLVLNDPTLQLPAYRKIPGTMFKRDVSWLPPNLLPRNPDADDYLFTIVEGSMGHRTAKERLASLNEATQQIIPLVQMSLQGAPIDIEKVVQTQAKYRDTPELLEWWAAASPSYMQEKTAAAGIRNRPAGTGEYTRTSVSESTGNNGEMAELLNNISSEPAAPQQ